MTGSDLLCLLLDLPADVLGRHLEIVVESLPRETFTVVEAAPADENDIAWSRDPETTKNALVLWVRA